MNVPRRFFLFGVEYRVEYTDALDSTEEGAKTDENWIQIESGLDH